MTLMLCMLAGAGLTPQATATPLLGRWQPPPMTALFLSGDLLSPSRSGGAQPGPALEKRYRGQPPLPTLTQSGVAAGLLPRASRWLLFSRTSRDEAISASTVLPPQREAGMPSGRASRAFAPLRDPDHRFSAIMFLGGMVLFLSSFVLGMLSEPPAQPHLPQPGLDPSPLLPVLITSPCLPAPPRSTA